VLATLRAFALAGLASAVLPPTSPHTRYAALSCGRIVVESDTGFNPITLQSSTSLTCIAFSQSHMAACRSYNYFDKGLQARQGTRYPYNEVIVRVLSRGRRR
jgi:hypothetical protein